METTKDRLLLVLRELGISQKKFEVAAGLSNGYVNKLKSSPSVEVMQRIVGAYPQINPDWLMTGAGEMMRPVQSVGDVSHSTLENVNVYSNDNAFAALLSIVNANTQTTSDFIAVVKKSQEQTDNLISMLRIMIERR